MKSRATHCPQDMLVPGLIFSSGARVALRFSCAGLRNVPLFAAPPATSASVRPSTVHRHVAKAKRTVALTYLYLSADRVGDPPDFVASRLE